MYGHNKEYRDKCQKKLDYLLQNFDEKTIRQNAINWLKNYKLCDGHEYEWVNDAIMIWSVDKIDLEMIMSWGKPVEHLFPK